MSIALKPYPEYKDSGVPWLGKVPAHWGMERAKWLFERMQRPVRPIDETVTCFRDGMVTLRKNRRTSGFTESLKEIGYQGVRRGDLVIHAMDAFAGAIGVSDSDGKCTPVYAVCQPKRALNSYFYAYIVREMSRTQYIVALSRGIRQRSSDFRFETFAYQELPVPSFGEQESIAAFLLYIDHLTRHYIRAQRRLIELLSEQKQALIQQAVTRGLDPHVKLKPSGVEWLGEIPAHWDERPAKYLFREVDERSQSGEEELLSVSHITGVTPRSQKNITMFKAESYVGYKLCRADDLVINTMWAWMAALGVAKQTGIVSSSYAVYRPINSDAFVSEYVDYLLHAKPYVSEYICRSTGIRSSRLRLYPEQFLKISLICPPYDEQNKIAKFVEGKTFQLDRTITRTQRQIDLIREYRTRLIADVVTGKLDVRGVSLPDLDDLDDLEEDAELDDLDMEEIDDADD